MSNEKAMAGRALIQASVLALVALAVFVLIRAAEVFLVGFAGILLAVLLHGVAEWIRSKVGWPYEVGLAIAVLFPLLLLGLGIWLMAPDVSTQAAELAERIPEALTQLQDRVREWPWAGRIMEQKERIPKYLPDGSAATGFAARFFSSTFGGIGDLVIALVIGLFIAMSPKTYVEGVLHLVPLGKRDRARHVLRATGSALRSWLTAKIIAMMVIGVLTTVGLMVIGIDLALVLGILAALLSFVPNVGPVIALIPAALIALIGGTHQLIYVVMLYVSVQALESYVLTPMLQKQMVDLQPALTIGMQVLLGVLAGALGVIVATPLTAVGMVMVRMWYVEDLLGDHSLDAS